MKYRNDLKIEFKAESYGSLGRYHVLMFRISPNQPLTYTEERSFLGFKYKVKNKFETSWYKAYQYLTCKGDGRYDKPQTNPVLMKTREEFKEWKSSCKTMGDFFERLDKINEKEINKWERDRENYLNESKTWF